MRKAKRIGYWVTIGVITLFSIYKFLTDQGFHRSLAMIWTIDHNIAAGIAGKSLGTLVAVGILAVPILIVLFLLQGVVVGKKPAPPPPPPAPAAQTQQIAGIKYKPYNLSHALLEIVFVLIVIAFAISVDNYVTKIYGWTQFIVWLNILGALSLWPFVSKIFRREKLKDHFAPRPRGPLYPLFVIYELVLLTFCVYATVISPINSKLLIAGAMLAVFIIGSFGVMMMTRVKARSVFGFILKRIGVKKKK